MIVYARVPGMGMYILSKKSTDFALYYNFKIVLVKENGDLKIGHFEFMRANMMD